MLQSAVSPQTPILASGTIYDHPTRADLFDRNPVQTALLTDKPFNFSSPLQLAHPPEAESTARSGYSVDNLFITGQYSGAETATATFHLWLLVVPPPGSKTEMDEAAAYTAYQTLHHQFNTPAWKGETPFGLLPSDVTVDPEPTVPPDHTPYTPAPSIPEQIERDVRCYFKITVDQDSPAATALYKAAAGVLSIQPLHTPLDHLHPSQHTYIRNQHPLITRTPTPPPPAPGPRWALESPSFTNLNPSQCWTLITKTLTTQAARLISHRQHRNTLTTVTKTVDLPTDIKSLLDFADILQPAGDTEHILTTPKDPTTSTTPTPRILYRPPLLYNNPLSNQITPFTYTLPHPDRPAEHITFTVFPPSKDMDPGSMELAQYAEDTKVLLQCTHHMSLYFCPSNQPPPDTWLYSFMQQLSTHLPDLISNIPPEHTELHTALTDPNSFTSLNPLPNGSCMETHISQAKGLNCCISLSLPAYAIAIQQTSWAITTGQQTLKGGEWVPQLTTLHVRPAHRSLLGEGQSASPVFTSSHLPNLHWVKGNLSSHPQQKITPTLPHIWQTLHYLETDEQARETLVELVPRATRLDRAKHWEAKTQQQQDPPPPTPPNPPAAEGTAQGRNKKPRRSTQDTKQVSAKQTALQEAMEAAATGNHNSTHPRAPQEPLVSPTGTSHTTINPQKSPQGPHQG